MCAYILSDWPVLFKTLRPDQKSHITAKNIQICFLPFTKEITKTKNTSIKNSNIIISYNFIQYEHYNKIK